MKDPNPYDYSNMPTETQDVGMYISAIFTSTPEEFQASYGAFDAVMTKYRIMVSVLKKIGVCIWVIVLFIATCCFMEEWFSLFHRENTWF